MMRALHYIYAAILALIASASAAQAGPVFFAALSAGAGVGAAFAATSVGAFFTTTFLGRLLGSVALSLLQGALGPKPTTPGITTEFTQNGGTNPCSFVLGKYATAGDNMAPPMTHGKAGKTPNAYLTYVIELSDVPGQTLSRVLIDGAYETFSGAVHADYGTAAVGRLAGYAWIKYYDGTQIAADPGLRAKYGSYPERPWLSDMIGTGICYAILTFRFNRELFQAYPQCRFEMGGIKLYDPRSDTSVGGSGAQRWADPATWTASDNPMVMTYNIKRGITLPGLGIWGGDAVAADLPLASWFAAMNACDVAIPLAAGGTEPAWRAGYEVTVDKEPASVIEELLKTCAGQVAEVGGQWKARVGGVGLPVYFLTDADIIVTKPQDYDPFPSSDRRMNGIDAQYPDPTEGWDPKSAPARYNATWETEDGGKRRVASLDLPACPYPNQVQRVMTGYIADERKFRRHNMTLPPDAAIIEPLDCISWTSARNGYAAKLFDVAEMVDDVRRLNQGIAVREVDAADFDWSTGFELPVSYASAVVPAIPTQTIEGFDLLAHTVTDDAGTNRRAALRLVWVGAEQDAVTGLEYEVRVAATGLLIKRGTITDVASGELYVSDGILPSTTYEARMRPVAAIPTAWTSWDSVATDAILLSGVDVFDGAITAEKLSVDWLRAGRLSATYLDVDGLLSILPDAGLRYEKNYVSEDAVDGLYFGVDTDAKFGFSASRTSVAGANQSIKLSSETGLKIKNARHYVSGLGLPVTTTITADLAKSALPAGMNILTISCVGGGGSGQSLAGTGASPLPTTMDGTAGGSTTLKLYDGATLKHTLTAAGGGIKHTTMPGQASAYAAGGAENTAGTMGSGGGGSHRRKTTGDDPYDYTSLGGKAGAFVSVIDIDVSGYVSPMLEVTVGAGGLPNAASNHKGGAGGTGAARYTYSSVKELAADVVPLIATAKGSFNKANNTAGVFPDLGAGVWMLNCGSADTPLSLGLVDLGDSNTFGCRTINQVTLISSKTPTYTGGPTARTIYYAFYSMGGWG